MNEKEEIIRVLAALLTAQKQALLWAHYNGGFMQSIEPYMWQNKLAQACRIAHAPFELTAWGRKIALEFLRTLPIRRRG